MLALDRYQEIWFASDIKKEVKKYEINFERELWRTVLFCEGCFHACATLWIRKGRSEIGIWHSARRDCLQRSLVSVSVQLPRTSPSSHTSCLAPHRKPPLHKELSDHMLARKTVNNLQKLRQVEKRLFPWHNLINTMHHSFGKPAVMWEGAFLSPDNYCLFGGLKWHGREKGDFKISSNFIAYNGCCQHMLWQSKKSISAASFLG